MSNDTLALAQTLIARRSLTPADDECQQILIGRLEKLGFHIEKMRFGDVDNLWAGMATPHQYFVSPDIPMLYPPVR